MQRGDLPQRRGRLEQHGDTELVTPEPGGGTAACLRPRPEPMSYGGDEGVAGGASEGVVDAFEPSASATRTCRRLRCARGRDAVRVAAGGLKVPADPDVVGDGNREGHRDGGERKDPRALP